MKATQVPGLYIIKNDEKGRCVHSMNEITKGDLIELCPVISFSKEDLDKIHHTRLHDYYFLWGADRVGGAIALGYGSLYNHDENPNAAFEIDIENESIRIFCIKDIASGEEITINYIDSDFRDDVNLWF